MRENKSVQPTLSVKQACKALSIGKTSFYKLIGNGQLTAIRLGRRTLVISSELERFLASLPVAATDTLIRQKSRSGVRP